MAEESKDYAETWIAEARVLSEALPYMRRHAGSTIVVKYGGHSMVDPDLSRLFARDIVLLRQVGINPIVVHGGGPQIGAMLERLGVRSEFIEGHRVTDEATVEVVEMVLSGTINKQIVSNINEAGGRAVGLSGKDSRLIQADKLTRTRRDPKSNIEKVLDLGLVGEPRLVDPHILSCFINSDITPVIAPIGVGPKGETLNINADTAAGAIASAAAAARLYILTDVVGVLGKDGKVVPEITAAEAQAAIEAGTIEGGMIPKVETCLKALNAGVEAATIIDGRVPHAILIELFTRGGVGTQIIKA